MFDAPRSDAPRTIDDARIDALIAKTLQSTPVCATHWSTCSMASATGLSQSVVSRVWRAFGLPSASSLNQVERWFATLTERCIRRGTHRSTRQLEQAIRQHIDIINASPEPFV